MDTIIVEIFLPAINMSRDFILPAHVPVGSILPYLIDVVRDCANALVDEQHPCICDMKRRRPILPERTLAESGVRDGSRLMLI